MTTCMSLWKHFLSERTLSVFFRTVGSAKCNVNRLLLGLYQSTLLKNKMQRRFAFGKYFSLLILFIFCLQWASAQQGEVENLPKYDKQPIHFGFVLGLNKSNFKVQLVDDFRIRDTVYTVTAQPVSGLNLGIISNLRMWDFFDLRFIPSLSFAQRNLVYHLTYSDTLNENITKKIESTYLEFPLDLKFKSKRIGNYRVYVLGGFKYAIDMVSQEKVLAKDKEIVKLNRYDYGYEIGVGFDFYMTYFKFSPEIKMFNGMTNLLVQDGRMFAKPIKALYSKTFLLSFTFE